MSLILFATVMCASLPVGAETTTVKHGGLYGFPGLVDMPTAEMQPDATLSATIAHFGSITRNTLSFQLTPRLAGSFRYSIHSRGPGPALTNYDRSFDLRYQLFEEQGYWPALAVGVQDLVGTGRYSAEYVVATKHFTPRFSGTLGMGWGRLATSGGFSNPLGVFYSGFETRPSTASATGGKVNFNTWFRGDAALFGGIAWRATDRLSLVAEYSSDAYSTEISEGLIARNTPFNFGLTYRLGAGASVGAYYLHGDKLAANLTFSLNPKSPPLGGNRDSAPPVIYARPSAGAYAWPVAAIQSDTPRSQLGEALRIKLSAEGLFLEGWDRTGDTVRVRVRNQRYLSVAQAVGRTARLLTQVMPAEIEHFSIVISVLGMPSTVVTLRRSSLEDLETAPDRAWQMYVRASIKDPLSAGASSVPPTEFKPVFTWSVNPYMATELFDPDSPIRADFGVALGARYEPFSGFVLSGNIRKSLFGDLGSSTRPSTSVLPHVRSDSPVYNREGDPAIQYLLATSFFRPGPDLYGRVSLGYFEKMYGGLSAELLWKRVDKPYGLGVEVNYARQRDFDQLFGFQSYDIVTGHVSAYLEPVDGYRVQLDAGRYLAGDWGTTLSLDREFDNGWKVGAYATFTDVSAADFGEGAFDKGLRFTIPLSWALGRSSRIRPTATIQPILRDGGARLQVPDRLFDMVKDAHEPAFRSQRARFWR
ncbi:YjbH domain-containing protein [Antarcticimicrobium sediminis]|uniref:YjbH domain-containing protein n=1 Tax=Antarcticimicrobium sediminis TaxID=2546227 RepID=A0A4R5EV67_9RHOB|nr:YjbH domain-containing protein [Antarcticimicrobium sediminis]TDE38858.1 YjbH domain-containing protein [Antarcticimicrobium sediminis]